MSGKKESPIVPAAAEVGDKSDEIAEALPRREMQIRATNLPDGWTPFTLPKPGDLKDPMTDKPRPPEPGYLEARRRLSAIVRSRILVILSGSGTSFGVPGAPSMSKLWDLVKNAAGEIWEPVLQEIKWGEAGSDIENLLSKAKIFESVSSDPNSKLSQFIEIAEQTIASACDFIQGKTNLDIHAEFLRRVTTRSSAAPRPRIFTTNYDLAFEEAGSRGRYILIDGFSLQAQRVFEPGNFAFDVVRRSVDSDQPAFARNVVQFLKIHGSIDWTRTPEGEIVRTPERRNPLLIYPRSDKYQFSFEQPYLEMMSALQTNLREPDVGLIITGFGFNDRHIAEPILSAVRSNIHLKLAICDPGMGLPPSGRQLEESNEHLRRIKTLIDRGDQRLSLISCTFEELVQLLPDLATEGDIDRHEQRTREVWAEK